MRPRVAMVTRWGVACGMDNYSRELVEAVRDKIDVRVHAGRDAAVSSLLSDDVAWDWDPDSDDVSQLIGALREESPNLVHIQFNWGAMHLDALGQLMDFAKAENVPLVLQLHATFDSPHDRPLRDIADKLKNVQLVVVHGAADVKRLEAMGVSENVKRWRLGERGWPRYSAEDIRRCLGIADSVPVIATFGFLQPRKNTLELLRAVPLLVDEYPNVLLLSLSALHPRGFDPDYFLECRQAITESGMGDHICLVTKYLPQAAAMVLLQASDAIVLPYVDTPEGTSAAAKFCAAAGRPMIVSSEPIFDDYRDTAVTLRSMDSRGIASSIRSLLPDADLRRELAAAAAAQADRLSWSRVSAEYVEIVRGLLT